MKLVSLGAAAASLFAASLPLGRAVPVKRDDSSDSESFVYNAPILFMVTDLLSIFS